MVLQQRWTGHDTSLNLSQRLIPTLPSAKYMTPPSNPCGGCVQLAFRSERLNARGGVRARRRGAADSVGDVPRNAHGQHCNLIAGVACCPCIAEGTTKKGGYRSADTTAKLVVAVWSAL